MRQYVPAEQLWSLDWNGDMDFDYDHETYWPALNDMCKKRREDKLARWLAAGSVLGESEEYLAGGTNTSISGFKYEPGQTTKDADVEQLREKLETTELAASDETPAVAAETPVAA